MGDEQRLQRYEKRSAPYMIGLALVFLGLYAASVLWLQPPYVWHRVLFFSQWAIWLVFLADFGYRIFLAPQRGRYIASHPLDVITLILPMFRPFRALRVFAAARILIDRGAHVSYGRVATSIVVAAAFIVFVGALSVLQFERADPQASITTFGDAVWWAVVTMATVGYGDTYPITAGGRFSAVAMMMVGISLIGAVTATFAAWFTERVRGPEDLAELRLIDEVGQLRAEIAALRAAVQGRDAE